MKNRLKKQEKGFTIIEVLIVLAIAGLIMVIVLVAVPQLQRNQRNSARQAIAGRIATEVSNYAGNNNGNLPTADNNATTGFTGGFLGRYLTNINVNDPRTGDAVVRTANSADANGPGATTFTGTPAAAPRAGSIDYRTGFTCNGEVGTTTGSARNFALVIRLEGGTSYCLDNR